LAASQRRSIVWIKEEGLDTPPLLAPLSGRGWSAHVLGFGYDRWRRFRIGQWIWLSVVIGNRYATQARRACACRRRPPDVVRGER
jgi:hypothetical protein